MKIQVQISWVGQSTSLLLNIQSKLWVLRQWLAGLPPPAANCKQRLSKIHSHVYLRTLLPSGLYQALQSFSLLHGQDYHILETVSFFLRIFLPALSFFLKIVICLLLLLIRSPSPGLNSGGWTGVLIQTTPAPSFYLIKTEWTATNLPLQLWIKRHCKNFEYCSSK